MQLSITKYVSLKAGQGRAVAVRATENILVLVVRSAGRDAVGADIQAKGENQCGYRYCLFGQGTFKLKRLR